MAITTVASRGFENKNARRGEYDIREHRLLDLDPGVTYTPGDLCTIGATAGTNGVPVLATAALVPPFFIFEGLEGRDLINHRTSINTAGAFVTPANTNQVIRGVFSVVHQDDTYKVSVTGFLDQAVASASDDRTFVISAAAIAGVKPNADDEINGAIGYVYDGTGEGQVFIVEDFTAAGTTIVTHSSLSPRLDSTSIVIILTSDTNTRAIGPFGLIGDSTRNSVAVPYANTGFWRVVDWSAALLAVGQIGVSIRAAVDA
ncbi:MAG: hypothetical protein Q8S13_12330 [Dehalococcoidia bacterium]|nr:hypothetical protein [Dehalococcoidia bacterium]